MWEGANPASGCQYPCPSCLHGQAVRGPCHRPHPYPQTAPFLGGFEGACPSSALGLLLPHPAVTRLPAQVGNHRAPIVGTCWLGNGALRFGPETGQSERLSEGSEEGETA